MRELFVYYRVRAGREAEALAIVDAFQADLRLQVPGLIARLLSRPDQAAPATWMETYALASATAGDGIGAELQQLIESAARPLAGCIEGMRHTEVFVPVARG